MVTGMLLSVGFGAWVGHKRFPTAVTALISLGAVLGTWALCTIMGLT